MRTFLSAVSRVLSIVFLLLLLLACIGPFIASQIYLERSGVTVSGTVVSKSEKVEEVVNSNNWVRRQSLLVEFVARDDPTPMTTSILVDQATYDAYEVGSTVDVRYAPYKNLRLYGTFGTKLAEQPPFASVTSLTDDDGWIKLVLIALGIVAVWFIVQSRSIVVRVAWSGMLVAVLGGSIIMSVRPAALFEPGPHATATARVLRVERIVRTVETDSTSREYFIKPLDRVRLEFTPQGKASTVLAVDDIDANSIRGIAEGQEREVTYPTSNPRSAHLVGATYQHRWQNLFMFPRTVLYIIIGVGIFSLLGFVFDRVRRRMRGHTTF